MSEWLASLRTTNMIWLSPPGSSVVAHQMGDIDAGDRVGGDRPRGRDRPVAAVDQAGRGVASDTPAGSGAASPTARCPRRSCAPRRRRSSRAGGCRCGTSLDGVLILNWIGLPALTLIDVAKPWIDGSPPSVTCQSAGGSPGREFSQATGLGTVGLQKVVAEAGVATIPSTTVASASTIASQANLAGCAGDR